MDERRWQLSVTRYVAGEATAEDLALLRQALAEQPQRMAELFDAAQAELDLRHPHAFAKPAATTIQGKDETDAAAGRAAPHHPQQAVSPLTRFGRFIMHPRTQLAAALVVLAVVGVMFFSPRTSQTLAAENVVMLPEGGRLDALDEHGQMVGPCPLKHTDVTVDISGHFTRVTAKQTYENPYDEKIEAVYTFPLSHRGAVDRMTMTVGDRVIEGEVTERQQARRIYEAAREEGYVASLLEQERPNIFTQSVANIEPGETIEIEISYVETLESVDGEYQFQFPTVVAPRYIPGNPVEPTLALPEGLKPRRGVILQGPAELHPEDELGKERVAALLRHAQPIQSPGAAWDEASEIEPKRLHTFTAEYATGERETGAIFADGTGHLHGRWFYFDMEAWREGGGFAPDTDQVPDAARITPMPVRPEMRAGHNISISVNIDTGGPAIEHIEAPQHEIRLARGPEDRRRVSLQLADADEIPNRDFLLTWRQDDDRIQEATFTHTGDYGEWTGGFFTLMLQPPARVDDADARSRELIFVLDNSGSMSSEGLQPGVSSIDAAKRVINQAIDTMRPNDRFNIISFNNTTDVLWGEPRANTAENRRRAQAYVDQRQGGGGTEMRNAVLRALQDDGQRQGEAAGLTPRELAHEPADGRDVTLVVDPADVSEGGDRTHVIPFDTGRRPTQLQGRIQADIPRAIASELEVEASKVKLHGRWVTERRQPLLRVHRIEAVAEEDADAGGPLRIVLFVTDGLVGNDDAIIEAIRRNARRTRVFTIGMSRSPNRYVLDQMALVGRGAADYVLPDQEVDPIVERFTERIATPVLTDIELAFSDGLEVIDVTPSGDLLPDLYDVQPLVIHGRYTQPGKGTLTIRGRTGEGPYERTIDIELPQEQPDHDVIATLWARTKVDQLKHESDRDAIVALGETFGIASEHTSFVAVEKSRVTVGGKPRLVRVPIEFPQDMSWQGVFGDGGEPATHVLGDRLQMHLGARISQNAVSERGRSGGGAGGGGGGGGGGGAQPTVLDTAPRSGGAQGPPGPPAAAQMREQSEVQGDGASSARATAPPGADISDQELRRRVRQMRQRDGRGGAQGAFTQPEASARARREHTDRYQRQQPSSRAEPIVLNQPLDEGERAEERLAQSERDPRRERQEAEERMADFGPASLTVAADRAMQQALLRMQRLDAKLLDLLDDTDAADQSKQRVLVTVRLSDLEAGTEALRKHGFELEDSVERGSFVVGYLTLDQLEAVALLDEVRRIELVELDEAGADAP